MTSKAESNPLAISSDVSRISLPDMVAAHAARLPEAIAASAGSRFLTYKELDGQANRLARYLRSRGAAADVPVGLCLPRSLEMVVAALGIMKAGAAFVPMDPSYPVDRLSYMLSDAQAPLVVADASTAQRLPQASHEIVDIASPELSTGPDHLPCIEILPSDLAYIIYTSGSTGRPKGVEVTHANLTSLVRWHREAFGVSAADRASHVAGLGFDASVWELWPYLAAGASVHLADQIARHSPELLRDWLVAARITMSFVPTPLAERILAIEWPRETALRFLLTGGDALHHYPPSTLPFRVVNNYGPTECTVVATSGEISQSDQPDSLPPIGTAIAQTQIYLLDENFREVPDGSIGEMYIGGPSVARGYRNRPDLTGERFIANPFGRGRLYRTGDLARRLPGGAFAFMGRADEQIKIRGYRIEPKEIVHALNRHPEIRDSLVIARPARGESEKRLIAYITAAPGARLTHTGLRDALRDVLPEYMLPAVFVTIAEFPTTHNGKVDLARLPEPSPENTLSDEAAGAEILSPTEQTVAKIVTGLLGLDAVARDDNFFLLGGHSLLAAQLIARLRDACGVEIPLRTVFATPTVAMLAEYIDRSAGHAAAACAMTKPAA